MRVETSLAEMLLNAIASNRVWGVRFSRKHGKDPGDERRTFEDLNKVIARRLDSALEVAREQGSRQCREQASLIAELEGELAEQTEEAALHREDAGRLEAACNRLAAERDAVRKALYWWLREYDDRIEGAHGDDVTPEQVEAALLAAHCEGEGR